MEKIKYIDNNQQNGIKIDWKKVIKRCRALGIPDNVVTPFDYPFDRARYYMIFNERSTGKTTNWLILGLVLNDMYGIVTQYVRQIVDHIMPKKAKQLLKTVLEFGYIEKITDGRYNSVKYSSRGFYLMNTESGEVAPEEFIHLLSIDENLDYKSVYNAPRGDLIIFDEFISKYCRPDEFPDFEDLVKTIIRDRYSPIIVLLANTIDPYNIYFKEFEVYDYVAHMHPGDSQLVKTEGGTPIFLHYPKDGKDVVKKERHNSLFFGFKNPKLNAITGGGWAIPSYQHIPKGRRTQSMYRNHYIDFNGRYIQLDLCHIDGIGNGIVCHECNMTLEDIPSDAVIYTTGDITSTHERYCFGSTKLDNYIWGLYRKNRWYYVHNTIGNQVDTFVKNANYLKR